MPPFAFEAPQAGQKQPKQGNLITSDNCTFFAPCKAKVYSEAARRFLLASEKRSYSLTSGDLTINHETAALFCPGLRQRLDADQLAISPEVVNAVAQPLHQPGI